MMKAISPQVRTSPGVLTVPRVLTAVLVSAVMLYGTLGALAQISPEPGAPSQPRSAPLLPPDPPNGQSQPQLPPGATDPKVDPRGGATPRPVLPQARSDGARALEKLPQTAEEKKRQLENLYAQLATAENEEAAKKISAQIERLWRHSGSDTVNLLISRAAKVAAEKRGALAEKLLDQAVALAPDYTEGFSQRAFYYYSQNNLQAAAGDLRRVLALDPNHYKALEGLVQIWRSTDNKKAAYQVLRQLLDIHPFAQGAQQAYDELKTEVEGRGI